MSVGAIATPAKIEAGAMSATLGASASGTVPPQSTTTDTTKRLSSDQRQLRVPYAKPAKRLPAATSVSRGPAAAGAPTWPANATIATSKVPKIAPAATKVATSTRSPGVLMADLSDWSRTPAGAGSVRRWSASASEPTMVRTSAPSNPAPGATPSARAVTSTGPSTKMSSSRVDSSANAASRADEPPHESRPPRPHERPHLQRRRPRERCGRQQHPVWCRELSRNHEGERPYGVHREGHEQRPPLPIAVHQPTEPGSSHSLAQQGRRGDCSGQPVRAGKAGNHQHDTQGPHGYREPCHESCKDEGAGMGYREQRTVGL